MNDQHASIKITIAFTFAVTFTLLSLLISLLILFTNSKIVLAEVEDIELPPCVIITHCVRENWETKEEGFQLLVEMKKG